MIKLFNKYDCSGISVADVGLQRYINLKPLIVPKTTGRNAKFRFWKSKYNIVERLMNKLMVSGHKGKKHKMSSGHNTGKATIAYSSIKKCFEIIEEKTGE